MPFFILQLLHFKYISILPDTAFMFVYRLPSHSTSFLDVCAQWLLPISAILYFSVYDTDFLYYFGGFIIPRLKSRNTLIIKLHLSGIILGFITCSIYFCGNVLLYFECFMQKQRDHHNAFIWYFFKPVSVVSVGSFAPLMGI